MDHATNICWTDQCPNDLIDLVMGNAMFEGQVRSMFSSYALWKRANDIRGPATRRLLVAAASVLWKSVTLPYRIAQARRDLNLLVSLSDRELRDIGIGRHDVIAAAWLPPGESPTDFLSQVSQERRAARKAQYVTRFHE